MSKGKVLKYCLVISTPRAANNGWSTDDVRSKIGFVRSNP